MGEWSYYWDGTTTGDATEAPYESEEIAWNWRSMFQTYPDEQSVLAGYEGELEVTNPSAQTIRVATGAALAYGRYYENDAAVDLAGATPGAGDDNYYTVVLRVDWTAQTIRITLLSNLAGSDYPDPVQLDGDTWDLVLAFVLINDAGTVTIEDSRWYTKTPLSRVIEGRQGGDASDWDITGTDDYIPTDTMVQVGTRVSATGATDGEISITFPWEFNDVPIIFTQCYDGTGANSYTCVIKSSGTTGFVGVVVLGDDTRTNGVDVYWMAMGQS